MMVTLVGDVATTYFLLRELDAAHHGPQTLDLNNQTVAYFQNRLQGGVSNRLELDRIQANRSQTAAAIPKSSGRSRRRERPLLLLGRAPGRSRANR